MLVVAKFGGTSVANARRIGHAAAILAALAEQGSRVVAVVSAQGDLTDRLLEKIGQVAASPSEREKDACLAAGENISAALLAMALEERGIPAVSLAGWQMGLATEDTHGNARVLALTGGRIFRELEQGKVVVAAGFQGVDSKQDVTTLGRGGSDTTAVALSAFLQADKCLIYTDVDGVYDKDPRVFAEAVKYPFIDYDAMLALCAGGAQVLHDRCVALAKEKGIALEVRSAFRDVPGTLVGPGK